MRHAFPFFRFEALLHRIYAPLVFRRKLAGMGSGAFVSPFAVIEGMAGVSLGAGSTISRRCHIVTVKEHDPPIGSRITIGENSYVGRGCTLSACGTIKIGNDVTFGDNVYLSAGQHGFDDPGTSVLNQPMSSGTVTVCDGAWIGYGAFISSTSELSIGECAIVAANSVVTRDVEPFTMVGGVPARVLKRFDHAAKRWENQP